MQTYLGFSVFLGILSFRVTCYLDLRWTLRKHHMTTISNLIQIWLSKQIKWFTPIKLTINIVYLNCII